MRTLLFLFLTTAFAFCDTFEDFDYTDLGTAIEITDYAGTETGHLAIPSTIIGKPVTTIGENAFGLSPFSSLTIPDSVTHIKNLAFQGCIRLRAVTIPSSVVRIDDAAFFENYSLSSITLEVGDVQLGQGIFARCGIGRQGSLEEPTVITLGNRMTRIGPGMFGNCINIRTIEIPDSVTEIGNGAFSGCGRLSSFSFGAAGVTEIGERSFAGCGALQEIRLPDNLRAIGSEAFSSCGRLSSVTFPANVDSIGRHAFESCRGMIAAIFLGDAPATFENGDPVSVNLGGVFRFFAPGFKIYFLDSSTGFTEPSWDGYDSEEIDSSLPAAPWLIAHDLPLSTDFSTSLNSLGIDLFTCYAFNLNPTSPELGELTRVAYSMGSITLTYFGSSPGVLYEGQMSTTLGSSEWSTASVTEGLIQANGDSSISTSRTFPNVFLRIVATKNW